MDLVDDFGPMIPSPSGEVDPMEADFHSRGSIILCSHWQLTMKRQSSQDEVRVNVPKLYLVSAKDLKSPVLVFEENLGLCESWQGKQYVWSVKDRWTKWSHMFPLAT
jgi:hypothetical protein